MLNFKILFFFINYSLFASTLITNGIDAKKNQFPWQVSLKNKKNQHFCGGSIISSNFILTAAHCLKNRDIDSVKIYAGHIKLDRLIKLPAPQNFYLHHRYNSWKKSVKEADIALIELSNNIEFNESIQMISRITKSIAKETLFNYKDLLTTSGWGKNHLDKIPNILQFIQELTIIPSATSKFWNERKNIKLLKSSDYNKRLYNIYKTYMSGDYIGIKTKHEKSFCRGDSGGPMSLVQKKKSYLVGVGSHISHRECLDTQVFYYTDITKFNHWIDSIIY
ncbi:MAG: serine protease [Bacteriovoracaceae bacterium]|jgi:secreted trypsin-like serine protease|nr:serine protease [Bacteriovoracaceae bacterium]